MKKLLIWIFLMGLSLQATAVDNMTIFLKSCAYGTAAGALVGLASLAINENPGGKMNNIARGASLGLYAGIGFGLYSIYGKKDSSSTSDLVLNNPIWLSPIQTRDQIQGVQLNWAHLSF
jgi:hypothetical protein